MDRPSLQIQRIPGVKLDEVSHPQGDLSPEPGKETDIGKYRN